MLYPWTGPSTPIPSRSGGDDDEGCGRSKLREYWWTTTSAPAARMITRVAEAEEANIGGTESYFSSRRWPDQVERVCSWLLQQTSSVPREYTCYIILFSVQEETVNISTVFSGRNIKQTVNCAGPVNFCAYFQMRCASVVFPRKLDRQRRRLCLITRSIDNQHWLSINLVRLRSKHSDIANKGRQNVLRWRQRNS